MAFAWRGGGGGGGGGDDDDDDDHDHDHGSDEPERSWSRLAPPAPPAAGANVPAPPAFPPHLQRWYKYAPAARIDDHESDHEPDQQHPPERDECRRPAVQFHAHVHVHVHVPRHRWVHPGTTDGERGPHEPDTTARRPTEWTRGGAGDHDVARRPQPGWGGGSCRRGSCGSCGGYQPGPPAWPSLLHGHGSLG